MTGKIWCDSLTLTGKMPALDAGLVGPIRGLVGPIRGLVGSIMDAGVQTGRHKASHKP